MKVVSSLDDFLSLENEWKALLDGRDYTIFSTWEWLSTWWKHCGSDKKLLLLLAENEGTVVGIAPLMYSVQKSLGFSNGKIEFVGAPDSDYCDFIIPKNREECLASFFEYLNWLPEKWNSVSLVDIPQNASCLPFLTRVSKKLRLVNDCPYLLLPESYDSFLKMLSRKKRKSIKSRLKKLEQNFDVEFVDCSQPAHITEGMECLFELHQKKWAKAGCAGVFGDPKIRSFHLDVARSFSEKNWLSLYILKLSGVPVAAEYGFTYNSRYYAYLSGYDPDFAKFSVGNMLFVYIVRHLIGERIKQYDFLRGSEQYKSSWNAISRWNYQALLNRKSALGSFQFWFYDVWFNGNRLRSVRNWVHFLSSWSPK